MQLSYTTHLSTEFKSFIGSVSDSMLFQHVLRIVITNHAPPPKKIDEVDMQPIFFAISLTVFSLSFYCRTASCSPLLRLHSWQCYYKQRHERWYSSPQNYENKIISFDLG
jgi:hypothetical protein